MPSPDIRVLLVDDEDELVDFLSKRLLRAGFAVRAASSGAEAVLIAEAEDFDVAVVDMRMPGLDGIDTQRLLKQARPFLQTVVLTGHGSLDTALESGRQDAFRYLEKPVEHEILVQTIREAAERKRATQTERFREEVAAVMERVSSSGGLARDIMREVDDLRKQYGVE